MMEAPQGMPCELLKAGDVVITGFGMKCRVVDERLIDAIDDALDTGRRIRSDPIAHEFSLGILADLMGKMAEIIEAQQ